MSLSRVCIRVGSCCHQLMNRRYQFFAFVLKSLCDDACGIIGMDGNGPLAQWIRRRPPEPEIPGSSPGRIIMG